MVLFSKDFFSFANDFHPQHCCCCCCWHFGCQWSRQKIVFFFVLLLFFFFVVLPFCVAVFVAACFFATLSLFFFFPFPFLRLVLSFPRPIFLFEHWFLLWLFYDFLLFVGQPILFFWLWPSHPFPFFFVFFLLCVFYCRPPFVLIFFHGSTNLVLSSLVIFFFAPCVDSWPILSRPHSSSFPQAWTFWHQDCGDYCWRRNQRNQNPHLCLCSG